MDVWVIGFFGTLGIGYRASAFSLSSPFWLWDLRVFLLGSLLVYFFVGIMVFEAALFLVTQYLGPFDMPTVLSVLFSARDLDSPFLWVRVGLAGGIG